MLTEAHNAGMFGFNWVDLVIVVLLALGVLQGVRIGLAKQALSIAGFFAALFAGGWLFPRLLPFSNPALETVVSANLVLITACYVGFKCLGLGHKLHWHLATKPSTGKHKKHKHSRWETALGSLPAMASILILVWLLGTAIARLPFAGYSNSVRDSLIVQKLTEALPPVPAVVATFGRQINPNAQPSVLSQPKPYEGFNYSESAVQQAATKAERSVVRITSFGCGGWVTGSGFVAAPELVITNAHVVAGVKRPIIKYQTRSYEATTVLFDVSLDVAILRAKGLPAPPISLAQEGIHSNTTVAVLGYPGGNYQVIPGLIRENIPVFGRNIYDVGRYGRDAYGVQTTIVEGSSGSPIVLRDGRVAGVIFSKYDEAPDYAYAVASSYLVDSLEKAANSYRRVSTGACIAS